MIDGSYLDRGYSTETDAKLYAEFYPNGQLKLFRSGPPGVAGKSITLSLDQGRESGRVETMELQFEPQPDEVDESGNTFVEEFDHWVRRSIESIYELTEFVRRCSFCSKSAAQVEVLIAGPTAYICDECIGTCNTILEDRKTQT